MTRALDAQDSAVHEGPFPERRVVACGVEDLRGQEGFYLVIGIVHLVEPVAYRIGLDGGLLGQLGAQLAHGQVHLGSLSRQLVPGHILVVHPAPLYRLLVEVHGVVGPDVHLGTQCVEVRARHARHRRRSPGPTAHVGAEIRHVSVAADVDGAHGHAMLARFHPVSPIQGVFHPGEGRAPGGG